MTECSQMAPSPRSDVRRNRLRLVFALTTGYMLVEATTGYLTGSLALLADAGHMLTDAAALGLSLFAVWFAERPGTTKQTFGYYRAEILAAMANAVVLLVISLYIVYEAWQRFKNPPEVTGWPMLIVAAIGMCVNLLGIYVLRDLSVKSLNVKAAYLEVMSDVLGSLAVIVAGIIMLTTHWYRADPIFGAAIGLFIVPRTWNLLKEAVHILMEGTPAHIDVESLEDQLRAINGVIAIHDLHVWTLTSGLDSMMAHVRIDRKASDTIVLDAAQRIAKTQFGIRHTTIQLEREDEPLEKSSAS